MSDDIPLVKTKKPNIGDYVRSGSCLGEPQTNALDCLKNGDLQLFSDLLGELDDDSTKTFGGKLPHDHWINKPIDSERGNTLLMLAIESDMADFVSVLLRAGADAQLYNPDRKLAPIHVAAQSKAIKSLQQLFSYPKNTADVNTIKPDSGRTALHLAVESQFTPGVKFLLQKPEILVDVKDKKGGQTPLYMAVKSGQIEVARMLIENGSDIDSVCCKKNIAELINEIMPGLDPASIVRLRDSPAKDSDKPINRMAKLIEEAALIKERSNPARLEYFSEFRVLLLKSDPREMTQTRFPGGSLLLKAVDGRLAEFVEALVNDGKVDPNWIPTENQLPAVLAAAKKGDCATIKALCKAGADVTVTSQVTGETILHCILSQQSEDTTEDLQECLKFLLNPSNEKLAASMKKIINKQGDLKNTPLHHAARLWPSSIVRSLLEMGANIGMKNHWDEVPISNIQPDTMEDFLSEFCIQSDPKKDANNDKFEITFDYSFLAPPYEVRQPTAKVDVEEGHLFGDDEAPMNRDSRNALPETETLWYLSQSKIHRHLLKHPVITSFLWLKWTRIRRFFNRNLRFYLLFVFVLTWHIFETFGGESVRPDNTDYIPIFFGFYIFFGIMMTIFILRDWKADVYDKQRAKFFEAKQNEDEMPAAEPVEISAKLLAGIFISNWMEVCLLIFLAALAYGRAAFLWTALLVLTGILAARELMQMAVSLKRYVLEVENWIEAATIVLTCVILFHNNGDDENDNEDDLRRHLAAIVIVLSWAELITLVGKHPKLTRYNIYVVMFYKVMATFCFFLIWYAFFIVAFGLAFYIMLHKDVKSKGNGTLSDGKEEENYIFFDSPWLSLVKTSTMFVGELEFSDIPVNMESSLSPLSYVFFLSFVFLIVVVLMNLLNGLAVSDTGLIQAKAEIYSYINQVETISYSESLLLGDPFNFLSNWPAFRWLKNIPACSIWAPLYRNEIVQSLFDKIFGAKEILLFYSVLPNKTATYKLNERRPLCGVEVEMMDENILLNAKAIIQQRMSTGDKILTETNEKIRALEKNVEMLNKKIDILIEKLG